MKILVTGGAGFLGQQLIGALLHQGAISMDGRMHPIDRITCFDQHVGAIDDGRVNNVAGDVASADEIEALIDPQTSLVVHLAAVVSGSAEADFDLGMRVNLDGTLNLLQVCRRVGHVPRVLFTSSIAAFVGDLPAVVNDATAPTPQGSYGVQKVIGEQLVQDFARKGYIDGRSIRVPTVVVRPGRPNGAASGFASNIIREPLAGRETILPVAPSTVMWMASPRAVVRMFLHAVDLAASVWGWNRTLNLPGLVASMSEELDTLQAVAGPEVRALVRLQPDERVDALVRTWAGRFDTRRALAMGFRADTDFQGIVRAYIEDNRSDVRVPVGL